MLPVPSTLKKTTATPLYPVDLMPRRNIADNNPSLESIEGINGSLIFFFDPLTLHLGGGSCLSNFLHISDNNDPRQAACRPMTPRRVKRRSVTRGGGVTGALPPPYQIGIGTIPRRHGHHRSSTRSSGRRPRQNPVTRLMDHGN